MRILIDECLPLDVRHFFPGDDARTIEFMGWKGVKDKALLPRAALAGFNVFLTADRHMTDHFDVAGSTIAIVVVPSNRWPVLLGIADAIRASVYAAKPGQYLFMPR